jgi:Na+-transporting methylmalonyl-CoA/oxaloacetate decarboxylase gamma subunit
MRKLATILTFVFLLVFALPSFGATSTQQSPAPAVAPTTSAQAAVPAISEVDQLKLKVLLQDLTIKQLTYQNAQTQLKQLETDFTKSQNDMQALVQQIYQKAGLKQEEYDLNTATMAFTKKDAPAPTAVSPPPTATNKR